MAESVADVERLLTDIEARAPRLRKAGVRRLKIGDVELELAPADPEPEASDAPSDDRPAFGELDTNPLDDAATYGLAEGQKPPGFAALRDMRGRKET